MAFVTSILQIWVREEPGETGDHPTSCRLCAGVLPSGGQRPEREADHSPPSSSEVRNEWSYTSTPSTHAFMACTFTYWNGIMQTNAGGMRHRHQSSLPLPAPQEPQTKYKIISYPSPNNCKSRYKCLGFPYTEIKRPRREVTTHLQPVLRLGVTGSIPVHTLYVFMAQTGPPSPLPALRGATRLIITQCTECEKAHYLAIIRAT